MAGSVRSHSWPWRKLGKVPTGWHLPHKFGWLKLSASSTGELWERPDGSTIHHPLGSGPIRSRLICRRRPDGMVVHGVTV